MSEERKKHIRTQGKYSDMSKTKIREKKQSISPATDKESLEKRNGRYSSGSRGTNNSFSGENISPIKYEENSDHSFNQLEEQKKPIEITSPGKHVLSKSENGESVIYYEPELFDDEMAWEYFDRLLNSTSWHSKNIVINGEEYAQPRLIAWFGPHSYSYSGSTLEPAEMPESILEIKEKVEGYLKKKGINAKFNSVLLNLYRSGKDSVSWHSDDETTLGIWPTIASVSLGEVRKFEMRRIRQHSENGKNPENYFVHLAHGSLIVMDGCMQDDWQHQVPKEYHDKGKRINLTFRTVYSAEKVLEKRILSTTHNGESVIYYEPEFLDKVTADEYFGHLFCNIDWQSMDVVVKGKVHVQPRLIAWFGPYSYTYSGSTLEPAEMPDYIIKIKEKVEEFLKENGIYATFNSVLLNLYRNNKDSVAWHSDDEPDLGTCPTIASLSLGETRKFELRSKRQKQELYFVQLTHGSLLVMDGSVQDDWQHRIPKDFYYKDSRINLTFRTIYPLKKISHNCPERRIKENDFHNPYSPNCTPSTSMNFDEAESSLCTYDKSDENNSDSSLLKDDDFIHMGEHNLDNNDCSKQAVIKHENSFEINSTESHIYNLFGSSSDVTENCIDSKIPVGDTSSTLSHSTVNIHGEYPHDYRAFSLEDLLHCKVELLNSGNIFLFASSLKHKVVQILPMFKCCARKELEILCSLTDGSQTERTQKIIALRMVGLVLGKKHPVNLQNVHDVHCCRHSDDKPINFKETTKINDSSFNIISAESHLNDLMASPSVASENSLSNKVRKDICIKESVPTNKQSQNKYSSLSLEDLLCCEVELMNNKIIMYFAFSLKRKVLKILSEFMCCVRKELENLCLLTDGSQSERNQKLITSRMANLVSCKRHQEIVNVKKFHDMCCCRHSDEEKNYSNKRKSYQNPENTKALNKKPKIEDDMF